MEFQSLPYSLLPDIAIMNVDCAADHFVLLFLLDYVHEYQSITCENFIVIFIFRNKL